jgi:hypothetical protein
LGGATYAYLTSVAGPVENIFTIGNVNITLGETTGDKYAIIPGTKIAKDPRVTVLHGSEDCWLYFRVETSDNFDDHLSYEIADGWTALDGYDGVYYRGCVRAYGDTSYYLIRGNAITVSDQLTEEQMAAITYAPTITFTAYAIQREQVLTAKEGFDMLVKESE